MQNKPLPTGLAFDRRHALGAVGAGSLALLLPGCARSLATTAPPANTTALLDGIAWRLLEHHPELATQKGVDTGAYAALRADLATVEALDTAPLDPATRTTVEVIRSAYRTALDGFALPYGDVAVGSWRNTPYVVIQNVGQYIDAPNLLDADHPVRDAADAEAYLSRLEALPGTLDGETGRIRTARGMGLVPPAVLLERTIADARTGGPLVASLTRKAAAILGANTDVLERRATTLVTSKTVPALERQLAEIRNLRALANDVPAMWSPPARRRMVCLGAARGHDDHDERRRNPCARAGRRGGPARTNGPDPALARLHRRHGRRAHDRAGQGPALPLPRGRCGPRGDHCADAVEDRLYPHPDARCVSPATSGRASTATACR